MVNQLNDAPNVEKYVNALYWSITTMSTVGYGDIKPADPVEQLVTFLVEIVAGITFAYNIGRIGQIFGRYNLLAESYLEKVSFVLQFLRNKDIPKDL